MTTEPTPHQLGRYQIVRELGRGSMGVVYLARDPLIGRLVALKTVRLDGLDARESAQFRARFIREAQSAGILSHPNIVTIHDVVEESAEGATFIAMEYVEGPNLKEVLRGEERLEPDYVEHVVTRVADGLDYAHSRGVVHRDIKPANIMITADRQVKLADFGIAHLDASNLTFDGQLLGTPNYMAPEQIQGSETDSRIDIFSLGVVLYEMLTGAKPFPGDNLTAVTHRIVNGAYVPLAQAAPHVPRRLERVLERALAKDPNDRYQTARELARDLERAFADHRTRESLNATQVIFDPSVLPPAGAAAVPPSGAPAEPPAEPPAAGDTHPSASSIPSLPPPPPLPPPPGAGSLAPAAAPGSGGGARPGGTRPATAPPGRRGRRLATALGAAASKLLPAGAGRPSAGRLALVGVVAAALVFLVGGVALYLLWPDGSPAAGTVDAREGLRRERAEPLLRAAASHLEAGNVAAARSALDRARPLTAGFPELERRHRALAERTARAGRAAMASAELASELETARQAAAEARWDEVAAAADRVLAAEPDNEQALELAERARRALARPEPTRRAAADPPSPARPPPAADAPREPAATAPAEDAVAGSARPAPARAAGPATVSVRFVTAAPEGTFIVYADDRQIMKHEFSFYERQGLRSVPKGGRIEDSFQLDPGSVSLRVMVALPGQAALIETVDGRIEGGERRQLVSVLDAEGRLEAALLGGQEPAETTSTPPSGSS